MSAEPVRGCVTGSLPPLRCDPVARELPYSLPPVLSFASLLAHTHVVILGTLRRASQRAPVLVRSPTIFFSKHAKVLVLMAEWEERYPWSRRAQLGKARVLGEVFPPLFEARNRMCGAAFFS